jgi:hypothetical protein
MTTAIVTPTLDLTAQTVITSTQQPEITPVSQPSFDIAKLIHLLETELTQTLNINPSTNTYAIIERIAIEVDRICEKSTRIQTSGEITNWRLTLARYRLDKCIHYYHHGLPSDRPCTFATQLPRSLHVN